MVKRPTDPDGGSDPNPWDVLLSVGTFLLRLHSLRTSFVVKARSLPLTKIGSLFMRGIGVNWRHSCCEANLQEISFLCEGKDVQVNLPSAEAAATSVEVFINVIFPKVGTYWVEILLEGDLKIRYPLRVNQLQRPQNK